MQVEVLRLQPGEDLRGALEVAFRGLADTKAACIVSGLGSFTQAVLRFANQSEGTVVEGPLELLTLAGTLSADGAHLHASVSDAQGRVTGGHVMPGCVVRTTAELVIGLLERWEFRREMDEETGFKELIVKKR